MSCILCDSATRPFKNVKNREYVQCTGCRAILLSAEFHLSPQAEKHRYTLHNNDVNDPGYIDFVKPVVEKIRTDFDNTCTGLDFGCGTGPVIASELKKAGYPVSLYDPYFRPDKKLLKDSYDFIICCEVMEHFQDPFKEFSLLHSLLKKRGKLYCKTELWKETIDFDNWHYKNDQTHIIFYHQETLEWLKNGLPFSSLEVYEDFIIFNS